MVMAEISITPIGTGRTGISFYVAKALESISEMEGLRYELNPMGTVLESDEMNKILEAAGRMVEVLHNLGVERVSVILKVDSRRDKSSTISEKVNSVRRQMN